MTIDMKPQKRGAVCLAICVSVYGWYLSKRRSIYSADDISFVREHSRRFVCIATERKKEEAKKEFNARRNKNKIVKKKSVIRDAMDDDVMDSIMNASCEDTKYIAELGLSADDPF